MKLVNIEFRLLKERATLSEIINWTSLDNEF